MTTLEILQRIVTNHNRIAQILVSGDNAILIGDTIKDLRLLAQELQADMQREQEEEAEEAEQKVMPEAA